ncbi:peptidylprolyl isomerase [Bacillus sp. FJAT-27264]|uniref:peptidylprolyl isomerase n=1 Tax=Paenibacillus sp. (strain DSM 101736 / FJAT-27264) TaxID=1850362 RepID=UPI0008080CC2|nr:peptidylprolyl isomerase [Bacillus sp. FJAT-27264]OBZ14506.1 peptidylprolyl isomerase [Bacillus sp. FJAT-27264]
MDKKDLNENEHLDNNGKTEELDSPEAVNETVIEGSTPSETVQEDKLAEPVRLENEESVPVMNKIGENVPPAPAAPKNGKGWMIASIVLAAALIIVLIKPPFQKGDDNTAVATVNGENITKSQLYDKMVEAGGPSTLQSLITTTLVSQEAKKANITVTDADIAEELTDLKAQFGGEEAFNSALAQSGMTLDDLKKQMPLQVELRKILEPQVKITDDEIKKYYDENKAHFNTEEEVRASHILVKTKEEADAVLKELKDGKDFATVAKEKSTDTGSKDHGGDLNFFKRGDMVPEFADVAFKLKVGETSGAVKSQYGYHIIKVTDRKEAKNYTLDEKKDEIRKTLVSQKISELSSTWLQEQTEKAKITNTLTDAKKEATPSEAPAATEAPTK